MCLYGALNVADHDSPQFRPGCSITLFTGFSHVEPYINEAIGEGIRSSWGLAMWNDLTYNTDANVLRVLDEAASMALTDEQAPASAWSRRTR